MLRDSNSTVNINRSMFTYSKFYSSLMLCLTYTLEYEKVNETHLNDRENIELDVEPDKGSETAILRL